LSHFVDFDLTICDALNYIYVGPYGQGWGFRNVTIGKYEMPLKEKSQGKSVSGKAFSKQQFILPESRQIYKIEHPIADE